jgi:hypothetical protein
MSDQLIAEYLRDLRTSAWIRQFSPAQTADLERKVSASIDAALAAAGNRDDPTVYGVLDRLGPPGDLVGQRDASPSSAAHRSISAALAPVSRLRATFRVHGWGLAEIGGLLLLIIGPYILWWIGPIFGILLVRARAERWCDRTMHIATMVVGVLFSLQALMSLALFAYALIVGGSALGELQRILYAAYPTGLAGAGLVPPAGTSGGLGSLSLGQLIVALPAPLAGLSSGIYLAFSRRYRRQPANMGA